MGTHTHPHIHIKQNMPQLLYDGHFFTANKFSSLRRGWKMKRERKIKESDIAVLCETKTWHATFNAPSLLNLLIRSATVSPTLRRHRASDLWILRAFRGVWRGDAQYTQHKACRLCFSLSHNTVVLLTLEQNFSGAQVALCFEDKNLFFLLYFDSLRFC